MTNSLLTDARRLAGMDVEHLARWLLVSLGCRLTAFAAGADTTGEIERVAGGEDPDPGLERRLRNLYVVASFLAAEDGPGSAYVWLTQSCRELGDRSPAALLHEGQTPEAIWRVAAPTLF